jgi:hypothetical protein
MAQVMKPSIGREPNKKKRDSRKKEREFHEESKVTHNINKRQTGPKELESKRR